MYFGETRGKCTQGKQKKNPLRFMLTWNFTPTRVDREILILSYTPHRDSTCGPRFTWQMPRRWSQVVPNSVRSVPSDGGCGSCDSLPHLWGRLLQRRDESFVMLLHNKTPHRVKSGDLVGHPHHTTSLAPARPIHLQWRCAFRWSQTSVWKWDIAPYCWNIKSLECSSRWGRSC
jgi:hypothetical protein